MSNLSTYQIDKAIHPGRTLLENLEFLGISQSELAMKTGITTKHISNIINEKASITPEFSLKLEKVLGIKASFWDNLEKNYQATLARIENTREIEKEVQCLSDFKETYNELVRHKILKRIKWVDSNFVDIVRDLQYFFGTDSLKFIPNINSVAWRKYSRENINNYTLSAALRIGEKTSENTILPPYNEKTLRTNLVKIRELSFVKDYKIYVPRVKNLLAEAGVNLVCLPNFRNTYIQGATKWIGKDKVMIILKTVKQGEDKFWFNLLHEIGHILKHSKKQTFVNIEDKEDELEKEANTFASEFFMKGFQKEDILQFQISSGMIDTSKAVQELAQRYNTSEAIVAGRLSHEFSNSRNIYKILSRYIQQINYNSLELT